MCCDQQIPLERAFVAPCRLAERLGVDRLGVDRHDAAALAGHDPETLCAIVRDEYGLPGPGRSAPPPYRRPFLGCYLDYYRRVSSAGSRRVRVAGPGHLVGDSGT